MRKLEAENVQQPSSEKYYIITSLKYKLNQILSTKISLYLYKAEIF